MERNPLEGLPSVSVQPEQISEAKEDALKIFLEEGGLLGKMILEKLSPEQAIRFDTMVLNQNGLKPKDVGWIKTEEEAGLIMNLIEEWTKIEEGQNKLAKKITDAIDA